jgi:hypothetical protein
MQRGFWAVTLALIGEVWAAAAGLGQTPVSGAGVPLPASRIRLIRSTSGSKGSLQGTRFVIEDPRTAFAPSADRQVVVFFEFQGPVGVHHCEGLWKDPTGKVVLTSSSEYDARAQNFGIYWTLAIPETIQPGAWSLEARIDGQVVGTHSFEISAGPLDASSKMTKRSLTPAEVYKRGSALIAVVERLDGAGKLLGTGSGFMVADGLLLTAFQTVNDARLLRIHLPDGRRVQTDRLTAWNRRADIAFIKVDAPAGSVERASSYEVGDRCYFLDTQPNGDRVIVEASVVGRGGRESQPLMRISAPAQGLSAGGPLLDERGDVVGVLGGMSADIAFETYSPIVISAVPITQLKFPERDSSTTTLEEIASRGEFIPTLVSTPHFVSGVVGLGVDRNGPVPIALNQKREFSRREREVVVFVTWQPATKEDATCSFKLFDADNRRLADSPAQKARLRRESPFVQSWPINVASLAPGTYRVDLHLGAAPVWRTFFRLVD